MIALFVEKSKEQQISDMLKDLDFTEFDSSALKDMEGDININIMNLNKENSGLYLKEQMVITALEKIKKEWEGKQEAFDLTGAPFDCISKRAVIRFESNNGTTFSVYFEVLDKIKGVLQRLRNDFSMEHFGITYDEMEKLEKEKDMVEYQPMIKAVRVVFPLRLLEPDPRNV